jgi:hypothetical protein
MIFPLIVPGIHHAKLQGSLVPHLSPPDYERSDPGIALILPGQSAEPQHKRATQTKLRVTVQ